MQHASPNDAGSAAHGGLVFPGIVRPGAIAAIIGSVVLLLVAPLYAVAYFIKEDEWEAVIPWGRSFRDAAPGLWSWADPSTVYLTYGKLIPAFGIGMLLGLLALHAVQAGAGYLERWGFRVLLLAICLVVIGTTMAYYTPFLDESFVFFSMPGILLTMLGTLAYGIATIRARRVTRPGAWLLALGGLPGIPLLVILFGQITPGLGLLAVAWILIGRDLLRGRPAHVGHERM